MPLRLQPPEQEAMHSSLQALITQRMALTFWQNPACFGVWGKIGPALPQAAGCAPAPAAAQQEAVHTSLQALITQGMLLNSHGTQTLCFPSFCVGAVDFHSRCAPVHTGIQARVVSHTEQRKEQHLELRFGPTWTFHDVEHL